MKKDRSLDVVVVGLGGVGRALVEQIQTVASQLRFKGDVQLCIAGLADRGGLLYCEGGLDACVVGQALDAKACGESIGRVDKALPPIQRFRELATDRTLFVDATAAPGMAATWCETLESGAAGVVLANKLPLCEPWDASQRLFADHQVRYEATVGAGLPVLSTLRSLLATGDSVLKMRGALSGTLGYLVHQVSKGCAFSAALSEAIALGYVEPDPRADLSGHDVARKALILSRTVGWHVEMSDVNLCGLVPDQDMALRGASVDDSRVDRPLRALFTAATDDGVALRYLAEISAESIRVGLTPIDLEDPFAALDGPENRITVLTKRYSPHPLAIAGPGAGAKVTAAGVLSDLLDLAERSHPKGDKPCP